MNTSDLEFEKSLSRLDNAVSALQQKVADADDDVAAQMEPLGAVVQNLKQYLSENLTAWQKVLLARHQSRPQPADMLSMIFTDFLELHGDRRFGDDRAIIGGFAKLNDREVMVIASRKGHELREYLETHFGCAQPEGYRKALRLMKMADKADCPIITLVDTAGAYPGIEGEERHIGEAIATNLKEMFRLRVPIIAVITGEGGSGGALGLAVANRVMILENAYYSVITPEGCAAILWRSPDRVEDAARELKLTAKSLLSLGIVDTIIPEPLGGAHHDPGATAENLKQALVKAMTELQKKSHAHLKEERYKRFRNIGVFRN